MPYKSRAQQRLFHHLVAQGKLAPETAHEFDMASKGKSLPQHVKRKAFGGQVSAKEGVHCPACDYPLDSIPVAMDAGEGCPRCGYGDAKKVPHHARGGTIHHAMPMSHSGQGGEVMDPGMYRARGGMIQKYADGGQIYDERDKHLGPHKRIKYISVYNPDGTRSIHLVPSPESVARVDREHPFGHFEVDWRQWDLEKDLATRGARSGEPHQETPILENLAPPRLPPRTPTVGMGDVKMSDRYAHGGEMQRHAEGGCARCGHVEKYAHGGPVTHCARCGAPVSKRAMGGEIGDCLHGDMKELYPRGKDRGAHLDNGDIHSFGGFAKALKRRRG